MFKNIFSNSRDYKLLVGKIRVKPNRPWRGSTKKVPKNIFKGLEFCLHRWSIPPLHGSPVCKNKHEIRAEGSGVLNYVGTDLIAEFMAELVVELVAELPVELPVELVVDFIAELVAEFITEIVAELVAGLVAELVAFK